jgi:hypothetical protein
MSLFPDSAYHTDGGCRLLVFLGYVEPDELRVGAEAWLLARTGPATPASRRVREALGPPWPEELLAEAMRFRDTGWLPKVRSTSGGEIRPRKDSS